MISELIVEVCWGRIVYTFIYFYEIVEQQSSIIITTDSFSNVYFVFRFATPAGRERQRDFPHRTGEDLVVRKMVQLLTVHFSGTFTGATVHYPLVI
jgi:hypothetical protein